MQSACYTHSIYIQYCWCPGHWIFGHANFNQLSFLRLYSFGFENSHVIENMLRHTWQLVWLEKGEIYIFFQIWYREHTYLGADGVAANQRCSCLRNSRQSAHPIWSDWAVFTSYNGKNPCPLSLVNVKHDGCRCKISSFLLFNYAL